MAHFAKINLENIVEQVIVVNNEEVMEYSTATTSDEASDIEADIDATNFDDFNSADLEAELTI